MSISFPFSKDDYINLLLQRSNFSIDSHKSEKALLLWQATGSTEGFEQLASSKAFMDKYISNLLKVCSSEATAITNSAHSYGSSTDSLLSIGCGNAIVEMFIARSLRPSIIYLIDVEETPGKHYHGVQKNGAGYCSLDAAVKFLNLNLNYNPVIVPINPVKQKLPMVKSDLAISLYSAGFHYSMNQYSEFLISSLVSGGLLIFDERIKSPTKKSLPPGFKFNTTGFTVLPPCRKNLTAERGVLRKN